MKTRSNAVEQALGWVATKIGFFGVVVVVAILSSLDWLYTSTFLVDLYFKSTTKLGKLVDQGCGSAGKQLKCISTLNGVGVSHGF